MRRLLLVAIFLGSILAGCQCQCGSGTLRIGGKDGGTGGHAAGTGGGSGAGTGTGGSFVLDAGDAKTGFGPGSGAPFTLDGGPGGTGVGVHLDPNGDVVLNQGGGNFYFMWIANDSNGWVSKYDTRTGKEVGRYFSVIPKDCANSPQGPPCAGGQANGLTADQTHHPSRTALDLYGDVWVANRALSTTGSVTKIANDVSGCVDRNGNGKIDTSQDLNGDGQISTTKADGEMIIPTNFSDPTQYDECVLFTQPLGGPVPPGNVGARAIAISAGLEGGAGDIWVGIYHQQKFYKLDSLTGVPKPVNAAGAMTVSISFGPYGAIVDRLQRLWTVELGTAHLAEIDTTTGTVIRDDITSGSTPCGSYALGIDGKNRVWVPGWSQGAVACRYDPATNAWTRFDFTSARSQRGTAFSWGRGIAVNTAGEVFMSGTGDFSGGGGAMAQLIRFDAETGAIIPFGAAQFIDATDSSSNTSIGVGLDPDGNPWVNNSSGNSMKIDKVTGAVLLTAQQAAGLYTYSDFTGYELRNYTAPRGTYKNTLTACADDSEWHVLTWDALVPPNTKLQVFVKVGKTLADLSAPGAVRYGPFTTSPTDLKAAGVPRGKYLQVEFVLSSMDGTSTPILRGYDVTWVCSFIQ